MIALGTKIRIVSNIHRDPITIGNIYSIIRSEPDTYKGNLPVAVADDNDGSTLWLSLDQFEIVEDKSELKELRAWKQAALARFPDLATPESDDDFCYRMADECNRGSHSELYEAFQTALAFGRANPL